MVIVDAEDTKHQRITPLVEFISEVWFQLSYVAAVAGLDVRLCDEGASRALNEALVWRCFDRATCRPVAKA
jgi:hypothetical protein